MVHLISAGVLLPRGWMKSGSSSAVGLKDTAGLSCSPQRLNPNSPGQGFCSPACGGRGRGLVPSHPPQAELWVLVEAAGPEGEERRAAQDATPVLHPCVGCCASSWLWWHMEHLTPTPRCPLAGRQELFLLHSAPWVISQPFIQPQRATTSGCEAASALGAAITSRGERWLVPLPALTLGARGLGLGERRVVCSSRPQPAAPD